MPLKGQFLCHLSYNGLKNALGLKKQQPSSSIFEDNVFFWSYVCILTEPQGEFPHTCYQGLESVYTQICASVILCLDVPYKFPTTYTLLSVSLVSALFQSEVLALHTSFSIAMRVR